MAIITNYCVELVGTYTFLLKYYLDILNTYILHNIRLLKY